LITALDRPGGRLANLLTVPAGGGRGPLDPFNTLNGDRFIHMAGSGVYKHAVRAVEEAGECVMKKTGVSHSDIRIIVSTAKKLMIPRERVFVNIQEHGNTYTASIAVALDEALARGRIKKGDKVLLVAFGAGFTWSLVIVEF